jgi:hypothetical protein
MDQEKQTNPLDKYTHKPLKILCYPDSLMNDNYARSYLTFTIKSDSDVMLEKQDIIFGKNRINGLGQEFTKKIGKNAADTMETVLKPEFAMDALKDVESVATDVYNNGLNGLDEYFKQAIPKTINTLRNFNGESIGVAGKLNKLIAQIILPIPEGGFNTNYSTNYESTPLGLGAAAIDAVNSGNSISDLIKASNPAMKVMGQEIAAEIVGGAIGKNDYLNPEVTVTAMRRSLFNSRREQLFKEVQIRQFSFHHIFAPSSREETNTVKEIIQLFKKNMLPNLDLGGLYLHYPNEFQISLCFNDIDNPFVGGISDCVLTNLHVSNSAETLPNGSPCFIRMTTTFSEMTPLTRDSLTQNNL